MHFSASDNMCYLAEHIHYFAFHTVYARTFKQDLQIWWASAERIPEEAQRLQTVFLELSEADPLEAGCGWFRRKSTQMSQPLIDKQQWLEKLLNKSATELPVCEISARCVEAHYLRSQNCFLGLLSPTEQAQLIDPLMQSWQLKLMHTLQPVQEQLVLHLDTLRQGSYRALYTKDDNFTEPKVLVHITFTAVALWLLPDWIHIIRTVFSSFFFSSFDWQLTNALVMRMSESAGLPLPLLAVLLGMEVIGLAGIPQALWETYFLIYRRLAMCLLWIRFQRSRQRICILMRKTQTLVKAMQRNRYQWSACQTPSFGGLCFRMPKWVTIGVNPFFSADSGTEGFKQTFRLFPQLPRPGMQTRTVSTRSAWIRAALCASLTAVFLLDLPALLKPLLSGLLS